LLVLVVDAGTICSATDENRREWMKKILRVCLEE